MPSQLLNSGDHPLPNLPVFNVPHDTIRYGTPLWSVWASCPGCGPSQLLVHLQPSCWQCSTRSRKALGFCVITALQQLQHQGITSIIFLLNPKRGIYQPIWRKLTLFHLKPGHMIHRWGKRIKKMLIFWKPKVFLSFSLSPKLQTAKQTF